MYSNKESVNILTALLVRHGVEHVVVCPGSRNAPLVHNFSECPDIICHPVTDERSAGFIALGLTQALHTPVAVCVTSGSALLNVLPAAAEATYQHSGIIVISADRPAAWIDQLDGQTLPQQDALGRFVAKSVTLPEVEVSTGTRRPSPNTHHPTSNTSHWHCNRLINEAMLTYKKPAHPSVHINVPLSEPLFEFNVRELPDERTVALFPWKDEMSRQIIMHKIAQSRKLMFIIGQTRDDELPADAVRELNRNFVILSEPVTGGELPPSFTDQCLYTIKKKPGQYHPDMVIYLGGHTVSKRLRQFMRSLSDKVLQVTVSDDGTLHDVSQHTQIVIEGTVSDVIKHINANIRLSANASAYHRKWNSLRKRIAEKHSRFKPGYSQMLAVKLFEEQTAKSAATGTFYYANSMSIRLAALYANHYCGCNRGLNGIEGSLSVSVGAALAQAYMNGEGEVSTNTSHTAPNTQAPSHDTQHPSPNTYSVIGDLSFFYDENALWQQELRGNLRIMLLNNSQGGIFRNLKGLNKSPACDSLVSGHHDTTAEGICQQFNIRYIKATDEASLRQGINDLVDMDSPRPVLLEVITDVNIDELQYKSYYLNLIKQ